MILHGAAAGGARMLPAMDGGAYSVTIVASRSRTLYIGVTGNLHKRLFEHKQKRFTGFSAQYNCNRLVWFENYSHPAAAIACEKQLKGWRRARKLALIEAQNPAWIDQSELWYAPMAQGAGAHAEADGR